MKSFHGVLARNVHEYLLKLSSGKVRSLQDELEGRFSRAMTMLSNARDDMKAQLGKAVVGLTSIQINTNHGQEGVSRVEAAHSNPA
jgi:hypothetical protein